MEWVRFSHMQIQHSTHQQQKKTNYFGLFSTVPALINSWYLIIDPEGGIPPYNWNPQITQFASTKKDKRNWTQINNMQTYSQKQAHGFCQHIVRSLLTKVKKGIVIEQPHNGSKEGKNYNKKPQMSCIVIWLQSKGNISSKKRLP